MYRFLQRKLNVKMLLLLSTIYLSIGIIGGLCLYLLLPQDYSLYYPAIVAFYWITGILYNYALNHCHCQYPDKLLQIFLMARMIKFILTIAFLILGVQLFARDIRTQFALILSANYIVYTALELYIYFLYNKQLTNKNETKK